MSSDYTAIYADDRWSPMFGKLSWDVIPYNEPLLVATFIGAAIGGGALFGWVTYKKLWGYLWREWFISIDHKKIGIMYIILGLVMLINHSRHYPESTPTLGLKLIPDSGG